MSKSVYSIVLSDELIMQVDREAFAAGTSRSNLIARVLAEHFDVPTMEVRTARIFERVDAMLTELESFRALTSTDGGMYTLRSALAYKYKPMIKYSLVLEPSCRLIVTLRSQNEELNYRFERFFRIWGQVEGKCRNAAESSFSNNRYTRDLSSLLAPDPEVSARQISAYIRQLDDSMKKYFENPDDPNITNILLVMYLTAR